MAAGNANLLTDWVEARLVRSGVAALEIELALSDGQGELPSEDGEGALVDVLLLPAGLR